MINVKEIVKSQDNGVPTHWNYYVTEHCGFADRPNLQKKFKKNTDMTSQRNMHKYFNNRDYLLTFAVTKLR